MKKYTCFKFKQNNLTGRVDKGYYVSGGRTEVNFIHPER